MTDTPPGPLGRGAVVRTRVDIGRALPAGSIGLIIGQAKSGSKRYRVMFPGDPFEYALAAKQMDLVRGLDPQPWWKKANSSGSWINEDRFAPFREALNYARGHFSRAAFAFAKVTPEDAYWIHATIQHGFDRQRRQALRNADAQGLAVKFPCTGTVHLSKNGTADDCDQP